MLLDDDDVVDWLLLLEEEELEDVETVLGTVGEPLLVVDEELGVALDEEITDGVTLASVRGVVGPVSTKKL